jgi:hypothetical protein
LNNVHGEEVAHMLFGDGIGYSALFATHPPLLKRIKTLDPNFNPLQLAELGKTWNEPGYAPEDEERPVLSDFAGGGAARTPGLAGNAAVVPALLASVAQPQAAHYDCAAALRQALPPDLLAAAHDRERAIDLVFGLLLEPAAGEVQAAQLQIIGKDFGAAHAAATAALLPALAGLHPAQRLPLAAIAMPSLRQQPREQLMQLMKSTIALIYADGRVAVFEYCLSRVLRMHLTEVLNPARAGAIGKRKLEDCGEDIRCLLSIVAGFGQDDEASAQRAFLAGVQRLPLRQTLVYQSTSPDAWTSDLDLALRNLDELEPPAKALLLEALGATIAADGKTTLEEAELLRAVCAALHCPLPPMLQAPGEAA